MGKNGELTRHHIIPTSRLNGMKLGEENIALIGGREHEAYHSLFGNMTPDEIIIHLVNHYWNREENWVWVALSRLKD